MSRWLSQVTDYLEQLDDQAQDYVEENINAPEEGSGENEVTSNLDSILAQRGLAVANSEDDDDDLDLELDDPFESATEVAEKPDESAAFLPEIQAPEVPVEAPPEASKPESSGQPSSEESDKKEKEPKPPVGKEQPEQPAEKVETTQEAKATPEGSSKPIPEKKRTTTTAEKVEAPKKEQKEQSKPVPPPPPPPQQQQQPQPKEGLSKEPKETSKAPQPPPPAPAAAKQAPNPAPAPKQATQPPPPPPVVKDPNPALVKQAKESQKEVRTLRRHMLTLNKQLESVESEVLAQRRELEQAAVNMEKDRAKAKEARDKERNKHAEELKAIQAQHEATMIDQKTRLEKQLADMTQTLRETEQTRMQEGGNWDMELQGAVEREQMLGQKNAALEDEKATMLAQIGTLQSQQEALGDRIESLSQTADSAMEREREAEERLDQALSVHAHQISQRQQRESELERTIAELGAAMAAVRNKESSRLAEFKAKGSEVSDTAGENTSQDSGLRVRLDMALHDLETAQANLDLERQRTEALQRELREINGERTEEATNARMKQNKHDRQIAELTMQLSRLQQQSGVEGRKEGSERTDSMSDNEVHALKTQIKELSEEVLKAREKIGSYSSELATLKSRLKGAVDRAEKAEVALEENLATVQSVGSLDRMERGSPASGNAIRRRGGKPTSISTAMRLNKTEKVGKAVDALDSFSVSTGKYLRTYPMARAAFIMYLLMLHVWTFVVIFFHAHNFEDMHRDAAALPHGPDAMLQKQLGAGGQAVAAAVSAAKAAAVDAKQKQP